MKSIICPYCNSYNVAPIKKMNLKYERPFYYENWEGSFYCFNCGGQFYERESRETEGGDGEI